MHCWLIPFIFFSESVLARGGPRHNGTLWPAAIFGLFMLACWVLDWTKSESFKKFCNTVKEVVVGLCCGAAILAFFTLIAYIIIGK